MNQSYTNSFFQKKKLWENLCKYYCAETWYPSKPVSATLKMQHNLGVGFSLSFFRISWQSRIKELKS